MVIREASAPDLDDVLSVERAAFGSEVEAQLVRDLLDDPGAQPLLSLLALEGPRAVGHVLFTAVRFEPEAPLTASLLAPLAVVPAFQGKGIGGRLTEGGLKILAGRKVDLVFVLGYPDYYGRHGFRPAGARGFSAPYPIPDRNADAWMVRALSPAAPGTFKGKVLCSDSLMRPEYWRE